MGEETVAARRAKQIGLVVLVAGGMFLTRLHSYLLFHSLSELLSVTVALGVVMVAWNARALTDNGYLVTLGAACLSIAGLGLLHTLAYKGMGVFPGHGADLPTQLWIAERFLLAGSFLAAPLLLGRRVRWDALVSGFAAVAVLLLLAIFRWGIFPACFIEGVGLTPFKRGSEYAISLVMLVGSVLLRRRRDAFDPYVYRMLLGAVAVSIVSELAFTLYIDVYGIANLVGHVLQVGAFALVYGAIVETGFTRPYALLLRERKQAEERLRLLAQAGSALPSSLDTMAVLERAAHLPVPGLADLCVASIAGAPGEPRQAAAAHADPSKQALVDEISRYAPRPEAWAGLDEALTAGKAALFADVPAGALKACARDERHLELLQALDPRSFIVVPLQVQGRTLGDILLARSAGGPRYSLGDLALAEELGRRVAIALENARLYREAQEANASKDQFVALVSHELRNPLAAIQAGTDVLWQSLPEPRSDRVRRTLDIVHRNARLQARLVNDLLDLSRIARGKMQLQRAPVVLGRIVEGAVQAQQAEAEAAAITLTVHADADLWVLGDADRLNQVMQNLLSNALKFTPQGGSVRVGVCEYERAGEGEGALAEDRDARTAERWARVVVEDTGVGIGADLLPYLFEMFRQGDVGAQRKPGLGLGLALARSIVEKHGGRIGAESEGPGKGSRFIVELPLFSPPEPGGAARDAASRGSISVLLVEDNPDTRALLADGLGLAGWVVNAAGSGEEGLRLLARERPDVILCDLGLPGMDGHEFLRRARAMPGASVIPAFAVTGLGQASDVRRAREAGFVGHFVKPVDLAALQQRIGEWLRRGR